MLTFCIFSYNRGNFLKNCVDSIVRCVQNAKIVIFDDGSEDFETLEYLSYVGSFHTVVSKSSGSGGKHGGLYHNMQKALIDLSGEKLLCFLQDDTQLVRSVFQEEVDAIFHAFETNQDIGFLHPCFIRGIDKQKNGIDIKKSNMHDFFTRDQTRQSAGIHYSDICIFNPQRLLDNGWQFLPSEPENDRLAKDIFGKMLYVFKPFAMWVPHVPAYRGKRKTISLRLAEIIESCGFYPYRIWSVEASRAFVNKTMDEAPVAEQYLQCDLSGKRSTWVYNALSRRKLLRLLNKLEVWLFRPR